MSGILGIVRPPGVPATEADLAPMREVMSFWGGDGEATAAEGSVALAHLLQAATRSRTPLPHALPESGGVVVAADVRLDNRADLSAELGLDPASTTDEELVLRAYLRWGTDCPRRLYGAFAFAVWDGRQNRLVCARDHAGFRPFAYRDGPDGFVFATDPAGVAACDGVPERPDERASVARFVRNTAVLRERSLYAGVAKLPAGELLVFEPGGPARRARHWKPEQVAPLSHVTPDECATALRGALAAATASAVDGAAAVGAHLSGGIDSSAVAALAQRALAEQGRSLARGFSWTPPPGTGEWPRKEHDRVATIADALALPVEYTALTEADLRADTARAAALEPNELLVYEARVVADAARLGVDVVLSGFGGNELASFDGRGQLSWLLARGRWARVWREASAPARRLGTPRGASVTLRVVAKHGLVPLLPDVAYDALGIGDSRQDLMLERAGHGWQTLHALAPELRRDMRRRARVRRSPRATQLSVLRLGQIENRIEAWARAGAELGIDHRYPLLDRRVVELCLAMPPDVWIREGRGRWLFRQAVAPLLPPPVVWQSDKEEPARAGSWLALLADTPIDDAAEGPVRAHAARQRELASMVTGRRPPP